MIDQDNIDYSKLNDAMFLLKRRVDVANQIVSVLKDALKGKNLKKMRCLEIGTSGGVIGNILADYFGEIIGIDVDKQAAKKLWGRYRKKNLQFRLMSAMNIKYKKNYFDVVVTNQDYECVPDSQKLVDEIFRVLKPGGICFFGARNKLSILEGQYRIPFLSWFPKSFGQTFFALINKNHYVADYKNYWQLKNLCRKFTIEDYTIKILKDPEKYRYWKVLRYKPILQYVPEFCIKIVYFLIPNYIWILHKKV